MVCLTVGYSCAELYMITRVPLALQCVAVGYSYANLYNVSTCAASPTMCGRGLFVC